MELRLKPVSGQSAASERAFQPGERVVSFLYRDEVAQEIARADLFEDEAAEFQPPGPLLCRWAHLIKEKDESAAAARQRSMQTAEEMFESLYEPDAEKSDETDALKALLCLMLERKRTLKREGRARPGEPTRYLRRSDGRAFEAPPAQLDPETIISLQESLGLLI